MIPVVVGLGIGAIGISFGMSMLFQHFYTMTFSVIFGIFLSMIPNMLNERCTLGMDAQSVISILVMVIGFFVSYYLGGLEDKTNEEMEEKKGPV